MTSKKKARHYATAMHPTIAAVITGSYRYANEQDAKEQLGIFKENFIVSRQQAGEGNEDHGVILWVKGFALTDQEKEEGYIGNFTVINTVKRKDGKYSLQAAKLESELKFHPQRKRHSHQHPNWGHPILRSIKKKRIYKTVEEAQLELDRLHSEYAKVSIPLPGKLYIIIYSGAQNPPAQKFVMEIKLADQEKGGFYIDAYENARKGKIEVPSQFSDDADGVEGDDESGAGSEPKQPSGYFTSLVALKRNKKRKADPLRPNSQGANPQETDE